MTDENQKLKREKELLGSELAKAKKQCDEMIAFLTKYLNVGPDQVSRIMQQHVAEPTQDAALVNSGDEGLKLKLFGVWLDEDRKNKKREREERAGLTGPCPDNIRAFELHSHPPLKSSKVCN